MENSTIQRLITLNQQFYQTFALQFSTTRSRLQPGVKQLLADFPPDACILDLGCGNGELALTLEKTGFQGTYVGVDFSSGLLAIAEERLFLQVNSPSEKYRFIQADLTSSGWEKDIPDLPYNLGLSFAVLHHIPGDSIRRNFCSNIIKLLKNNGATPPKFIHSVWQFLNSPRLRSRIQVWDKIGLSEADIDAGDYLLDWRYGGQGFRYVHHFNEMELQQLADDTGFTILRTFYSDGEGGNLGLYQVWEVKRV